MKKYIALLLAFTIAFNVMFKPKKADAVAIADDLAVGIIVCLCASGYVVSTNEGVQKSAQAFWASASQGCKDAIQAGVISGTMNLGVYWQEVVDWVQGAGEVGSVEYTYNAETGQFTVTASSSNSYFVQGAYETVNLAGNFSIIIDYGSAVATKKPYGNVGFKIGTTSYDLIESNYQYNYTRLMNNTINAYYPSISAVRIGNTLSFYDYLTDTFLYSCTLIGTINSLRISAGSNNVQTVIGSMTVSAELTDTLTIPTDYTYTDVATNPYWDLENEPPIVPPWTPADTVGKTASDLSYTNVYNPPTVDTGASTEVGWLTNIYHILQSIATSIARFFDFSEPINFDSLKLAGTTFTNKFPFSLPWDLKNAFTSLVMDGFNPVIAVNIPENPLIHQQSFNIDLTMFNDIVAVVRVIELMLFSVGLVFVTRKLLGGDV